jgi:hypothetical protein
MVRNAFTDAIFAPGGRAGACSLGDGVDGGPARPYKRRFTKTDKRRFTKTDVKRNGQYKISQEGRTTKHAAHRRQ